MKIVYFDVETSGLDFELDRIIELAFLYVEDGKLIKKFDEFINVGFSVSDKVQNLTGITNEMLVSEGLEESVVAEALFSVLSEDTLLIAHNCQFDLNFIYQLLCRYYSVSSVDDLFGSCLWLDTLTVFKDRKGYPHRLENMVEYYDVDVGEGFHRAIFDVRALSKCVVALNRERNDLFEYVNVFGFNPKYGVQGEMFDFIRYVPQKFHNSMVDKSLILPFVED